MLTKFPITRKNLRATFNDNKEQAGHFFKIPGTAIPKSRKKNSYLRWLFAASVML